MPLSFPPQLHVFVRDWLSANHVLLKSKDGHVLIDSGYGRRTDLTFALLASESGIGPEPLARLINTHCHSDHMGGNAALKQRYDCRITIPIADAPLIERWDHKALLLDYADQFAMPFRFDDTLRHGDIEYWGDLEWRVFAAPGHDMAALIFFNPEHGLLISGDALWENGFGFVLPPEMDLAALPATRATLELIASLDVRAVIPGHGEPFSDVRAALDRAFARLAAFEADSTRMARHALKVILAFSLLDKQKILLADLPASMQTIGIYRDLNELFFHSPPAELAELLVTELERAGAARRFGELLVPQA